MICPQTQAECKSPVGCGAMGCSILEDNPPPKPTMEDIERLVDAYMVSVRRHDQAERINDGTYESERAARAALLAAIVAYGEG